MSRSASPNVITTAPSPLDWGLLALLGIIWGGSFLAVELAIPETGPLTLAALRIILGAAGLWLVARAVGEGLPRWSAPQGPRIWLHALGFALFSNAIPFTLLSWGQQQVSSGFAGITMAVVPLLVLPLSHLLVPGERLTARKAVGFVIGFVGVAVLIGPAEILAGEGPWAARLACIGAAGCYAIGSIVTRLCPPVALVSYSALGLLLAAVVLSPVALIVEGVPDWPGPTALGAILYLGVFPTALATLMLVTVIQRAGPPFLSLVNYQVPVWAVLFGVVVLAEEVPGQFVVALAFILAGLAISQARAGRVRP
ncbi:MAG: DMT family transporter [Pseudomonadota bacterium]